uniref:Uncharacterized protein n=1 Tax=Alexandrium catenella TaxID=2925 RepID=A0A7S1RIE2_ALECA
MVVSIMPRSVFCACRFCSPCLRRSHHGPCLKKQFLVDEDFEQADPGPALAAALERPGGQAQAIRLLKGLVDRNLDPLKYIDDEKLSRIVRIGRRFDESVDLTRPDFGAEGWSTGIADESRLWFAHRVDSKALALHVVLVHDIAGVDAVRAAAGYCSAGHFQRHSGDVKACKVLAQTVDSLLWNQVRAVSDDVVQVDLVNALDEPIGAIMLMIHPEPEGSVDFPAVSPPPARSARHSSVGKQCVTFTPLPGGSLRMHVAARICFSEERALSEISQASSESVARLLRPLLVWPKRFGDFVLEHRDELAQEEAFSPQAPFYAVCRGYLEGHAGTRRSSLHKWGYMFNGEKIN